MKLIISRAAAGDLDRLRAFLAGKNPAAAQRAITTLIKAIESLNALPERGRLFGTPNIRELIVPFGQSAYVLRYAYSPETGEVVVIRIWYGRELRE
jgi:toxin ParE1/3/4